MSSRVQRGVSISVEPMVWRQAGSAAVAEKTNSTGKPESPPEAELSRQEALRRETEIVSRCKQAHAQGRQEGEAAARAEAQARLNDLAARLARSVEEITGLRPRLRHEAEQEMVALALAIARRVLHREITLEPDAVLGILKAALQRLDARELHRIRVHPDTAQLLAKQLERMGIPQGVELIADNTLERGAVVLESACGTLDASIETQLAEIERGFADLVRRNG